MGLFLIGTAHQYQRGLYRAPSGTYREFERFVQWAAEECLASTIAEELSESLCGEISFSLSRAVACKAGLEHIYCDPDHRERRELGLLLEDCSRTWGPREDVWPQRLQGAAFPVLFICGADHVASFSDKCRALAIDVTVLRECWEPVTEIPVQFTTI